MITKLFSFIKLNPIALILTFVIGLLGFYAYQLSSMTDQVKKLNEANSVLNKSVSNIEADNALLSLSLDSEKLLRENLQDSIKENSERLENYLGALDSINQTKNEKAVSLENAAKELAPTDCINTTMPESIISLFNSTKAN